MPTKKAAKKVSATAHKTTGKAKKAAPKVAAKPVKKAVAKTQASGKDEKTAVKKAGDNHTTAGKNGVVHLKNNSKPVKEQIVAKSKESKEIKGKGESKTTPKKTQPVKEVKVPKTSVKTSVPYQPEYKPLDQRKEPDKTPEPLVRYSDAELNEFRELIQKKLDAAKKELGYLQGLITRKDDMGGDESENRYMTMEDGSISMEREQLSQMASRQITYIDHLEKALIRIENKTYGICRVTGKLIDKARLRAVPHATLSLEAKLGLVKVGE